MHNTFLTRYVPCNRDVFVLRICYKAGKNSTEKRKGKRCLKLVHIVAAYMTAVWTARQNRKYHKDTPRIPWHRKPGAYPIGRKLEHIFAREIITSVNAACETTPVLSDRTRMRI